MPWTHIANCFNMSNWAFYIPNSPWTQSRDMMSYWEWGVSSKGGSGGFGMSVVERLWGGSRMRLNVYLNVLSLHHAWEKTCCFISCENMWSKRIGRGVWTDFIWGFSGQLVPRFRSQNIFLQTDKERSNLKQIRLLLYYFVCTMYS